MAATKRPRLGRGLSSLIQSPVDVPPDREARRKDSPHTEFVEPDRDGPGHLAISADAIVPNPYQPRREFNKPSLDKLAESIRQDGLLQPIIVRLASEPGRYELVAGERRWRAARLAGLASIPAIVRRLTDKQVAEWAIIENLQREDLDPLERAEAFERLAKQFALTHEQIADRVGIDRSSVTNLVRLLDLPAGIQELIRSGQLTAGHGKALLGVCDEEAQLRIARKVVANSWSVRKIEQVARQLDLPPAKRDSKAERSAHLADLERQIGAQLEAKVRIRAGRKKNSGTLLIDYYDIEQFDQIIQKLGVSID